MKYLVLMQLHQVFKKKNVMLLCLFFFLISFLQVLRLRQQLSLFNLKGNVFDFFLFNLGGWEKQPSLFFFLIWSTVILVCIYTSVLVATGLDEVITVIFNKTSKKLSLWLAICVSQFLVSIILTILKIIITVIIGYLFLDFEFIGSSYNINFYNSLSEIPAWFIILMVVLLFSSGIYVLSMTLQVLFLITSNKGGTYMNYIFTLLFLGSLSIYVSLNRYFSPLFYASTLTIQSNFNSLLIGFIFNIVIVILMFFIGCYYFIKKEY